MSTDQDQRLSVAAVLDGLGPGPELDGLLEELSPAALTGDDLAAYLRGCARQQARADARTFVAMHHLGRAGAGTTERFSGSDEFSGDEVAAVLCWSRTMASRKLGLAEDLEVRLPAVGEALWDGRLDQARAVRFCEWTRDLPDDLARHLCEVLLPDAAAMPVGELLARIEQVAIELDPDWAARRAARAEKNKRLVLAANPAGTATLSLCDVGAPSGLAMQDRVEALAAAVRGLGVLTPIGTLRAQVAERLLDGSMEGLDDHRIALILAEEYHDQNGPGGDPGPEQGPDDEPDGSGPDDRGSDGGGPDSSPDDVGPDDVGPDDVGPDDVGPDDRGPDDRGPDDRGPDDRGPDDRGPDDHGPDDHGPDDHGPDDHGPDDHGPGDRGPAMERSEDLAGNGAGDTSGAWDVEDSHDEASDSDDPAGDQVVVASGGGLEQGVLDLLGLPDEPGAPEPFPATLDGPEPGPGRVRVGIGEVRLRLSTALGLDDIPGQVPGYGTVLARDARTLLHRYRHGEWRIVGTDEQGRLQHVLLARRRPHPRPRPPGGSGPPCRSVVELQVPTTLLAALTPREHGRWAPLLAELQQRLADLPAEGGPPAQTVADLYRRRPRVEIDRWTRVRDRCCVAPACRRRAQTADLDHTLDHALGGPSLDWNLGVFDRHHHRAKHHGGWTVRQPAPGRFEFRTRAGVHHTTRPKKILHEPVAPRPAARPRPLPDDGPTWTDEHEDPDWRRRYQQKTGLTTATGKHTPAMSAVHPDDDPPPF